MQNVFFVLKKKNSATEKIKTKFRMYFLKCSGCSQKNYVTELPRKNKCTAHINSREYHASYPFHKGQLLAYMFHNRMISPVTYDDKFTQQLVIPDTTIDIWLWLNNATTHAFFPNISVSPITLFHQINKKELHLHITPMKKI